MPELEAQSPVTREMAVEAAKIHNTFREHGTTCGSTTCCIMADYILQSPPLAAWDEKRCREFVERLWRCGYDGYLSEFNADVAAFTAELLASMPGGRVDDSELRSAAEQAFAALVGSHAADDSVQGRARIRLRAALGIELNREGK